VRAVKHASVAVHLRAAGHASAAVYSRPRSYVSCRRDMRRTPPADPSGLTCRAAGTGPLSSRKL
jgi:hypothetical protein